MGGLENLGNQIRNIAAGPPPAPTGGPSATPHGGGPSAAAAGGWRVVIPVPKGKHGIEDFDGKNYPIWHQGVVDHITDDGRDELSRLLK